MISKKQIGAGEFASLLGVSPETLRNWRRIGISLGGAAVNGRVTYDDYDIFTGTLMLHLYRQKFELGDAWRISEKVSPWLAKSMGIEVPSYIRTTMTNVFVEGIPKYALVSFGSNTFLTDDLADIEGTTSSVLSVVRVGFLAEMMRKTVTELAGGT